MTEQANSLPYHTMYTLQIHHKSNHIKLVLHCIPHQRLNFQILLKPGFGQIHIIMPYMPYAGQFEALGGGGVG